jgi:outer membrane protein
MKERIIAFIAWLLFAGQLKVIAQPGTGYKLTLKQCVEAAVNNNLQVRQSDLQMQAGAVNLRQAKANLLPDLSAAFNHGISQGRSIDPFTNGYINQKLTSANYSLGSGVVLFNGFQLKNLIRQNGLTYEADKMDLQQTKDNITLNVILAYLQILNSEEQLQQSKNQAEVSRRQVERLNVMNESGAISPAELYDLKGQLASDEIAIVTNQNAVNSAKLTLSQLMNVRYSSNTQVEKMSADTLALDYSNNPAALYDISVKQLAIVKASELRKQSAQKGVKVAKGYYYPTIDLSGNIYTNYSNAATKSIPLNTVEAASGDYVDVGGAKVPVMTTRTNYSTQKISYGDQFNNNYYTQVYLSIRVPILNRFAAKNRVALAKIDLKKAEAEAETVKTQLSQNIEQAYFNMTAALEKYKVLQQQVKDFSESFRIAEVRFNAGAINEKEYLIAKNNADRSNADLIANKYDYLFRMKILDYYKNKLSLE